MLAYKHQYIFSNQFMAYVDTTEKKYFSCSCFPYAAF